MPDVATDVTEFRQLVADHGRDPQSVAINIQIMDTANLDKLKGLIEAVEEGINGADEHLLVHVKRMAAM